MIVFQKILTIETRPRSLVDITPELVAAVTESGVHSGTCAAFIEHTSASLVIQENADPAVQRDLARWFDKLAPEDASWEHDTEGTDDMPAHARSAVTRTSEVIPVVRGELSLGMWQAVYVWEHRHRGLRRRVHLTIMGLS
ncbi:MAG: YjbQ family protein [Polyangiaceae bacterium]|nr:YjbQ family protein [Polyangiaceae bacterium]